MASRRALLALPLLSLAVLAGCVSAPAETPAASADPADLLASAPTLRFDANGTLLPLVDELAHGWYNLTGHQGAEPNVGITSSGAIFATADEHVIRSRDRGATWEIVWTFGLEDDGAPIDPFFNADPMLWVDTATDRIYADPMFPALACTTLAWSDDEGNTWFERHGTCHAPPMDHQKLGGGKPGPAAPPIAGLAYPSVLYQCYNMVVSTNCATSYDGGLNFLPAVPVIDLRHGCGGLNGMPIVAPDGTAVVASSEDCAGPVIALTRDSGLTWTTVEGPTQVGGSTNDPEIEFTPDGTMYVLWAGDDHLAYLARSPDMGQTWSGPWKVSPPYVTSTVFAAMVAGDDGRLAMAFLGTTHRDATDPSTTPDDARWHLYVVTTDDAANDAPTFTAHRVTPEEDPVQIGCVWMNGFSPEGNPCRNMLDFIDAAVHPDGTFFVIYTEGCAEGCANLPTATADDSRAREIAIARLDGWMLRTPAGPVAEE